MSDTVKRRLQDPGDVSLASDNVDQSRGHVRAFVDQHTRQVKNVADILIETFVTQLRTSRRYLGKGYRQRSLMPVVPLQTPCGPR